MSILKKLGFGKNKPTDQPNASDLASELGLHTKETGHEKRSYKRFSLTNDAIIKVDFGDGNRIAVRDIGYGGFIADVENVPTASKLAEGAEVKVYALGLSTTATIGYVYSRGGATAFRFHHNRPESLFFLREPLEALRLGSSLTPMSGNMLKAPYNQAGWLCLRGDGPTDLMISTAGREQVNEALMTFRHGEIYKEISLKGGIVKTSRSIDTQGHSASRMTQTEVPDAHCLRVAIYILAGITDKATRKLTDQLSEAVHLEYAKNEKANGDIAS